MIDKNNIPQGYKNSVVGIIPEEWEVKRLGEVCVTFKSGTTITSQSIRRMGLYPVYGGNGLRGYADSYTHDGTYILIGRQGALCGNINFVSGKTYISEHAIAVQPDETTSIRYLRYKLDFWNLNRFSESSAQPGLSVEKLVRYRLAIPPLAEQKKIAEILCTWDDAIEKQSKLIEKLELRKRGLMQCLLTGKTRLPGFTEPWINIRIGELCLMKRGEILVSDDYIFGDIPVVAGGKEPAGFHNVSNRNGNIITISSSGASAGFVAFYEKPIFATDCFTISSSEKYNVRFLYYYLMMSQERIYRLQSGGAQPHVHPKDLAPMMLIIPSLEEQNAVVKIILSSDKEIEIQRKKLEALRHQKQGLMQQLLTGKIRVRI